MPSCTVCCSYYLGLALALQTNGAGDRVKEAIVYLLAGMESMLQHAVNAAVQHGDPVYDCIAFVVTCYSAPGGSGVLRGSVSVCLRVCVCLSVRWTDLREILYADPLWPWLDAPPASFRCIMYFRFYG